jgi:pilus assembly protein CpaE
VASSEQIRLLVVEDVPQVAQYIRNLLATQQVIKLLDTVTDGTKAMGQVSQLRPDVVIVDALLQGRVKGLDLARHVASESPGTAVIVITVPQNPVEPDPDHGIHGVISMPFSGYDIVTRVQDVYRETLLRHETATSLVTSIFAPKGGVGKTTIAFNLAVAMGQAGQRTVLVDGSLQFGDMRALLKVPANTPSMLDLPTDRVSESDLQEVLWRDPSGIDILLAPPRIEMAEMITSGDLGKVMSMLRRVYQVVVIDTHSSLSDHTMAFLDLADTIVEIVTYDSTTIHNTIAMADVFRSIGYPATKVRYLVNRADSPGGIDPNDLARAIGRIPEHTVVSDGPLVVQANNEGIPFVISEPGARISQDVVRVAAELLGARAAAAAVGARR